MKRLIYHGSSKQVDLPTYGFGSKYNDYGVGFYCTEYIDLAKEWAVKDGSDGYANRYIIDESGLNILNLSNENFTSLHWITLLLQNRTFDLTTPIAMTAAKYLTENFPIDISNSDVVIGYRADDSYFSYARDFLNGTISVGQLTEAMRLGELGTQYVLKSRKAFSKLTSGGYETADADIWFPKRQLRDKKARRRYFDMDINRYIKNDLYMIQILDEEVKPDDARLR